MFNFKNLLTKNYLLDVAYGPMSLSAKLFLIIGAAAILVAIVLKIAEVKAPSPIDKKWRGKLFNVFLFAGLWEVIWFGLRYEFVRFFGSHFVALLGLLISAVWLVAVIVKMIKSYRGEKETWDKEQVRLKYLPR